MLEPDDKNYVSYMCTLICTLTMEMMSLSFSVRPLIGQSMSLVRINLSTHSIVTTSPLPEKEFSNEMHHDFRHSNTSKFHTILVILVYSLHFFQGTMCSFAD